MGMSERDARGPEEHDKPSFILGGSVPSPMENWNKPSSRHRGCNYIWTAIATIAVVRASGDSARHGDPPGELLRPASRPAGGTGGQGPAGRRKPGGKPPETPAAGARPTDEVAASCMIQALPTAASDQGNTRKPPDRPTVSLLLSTHRCSASTADLQSDRLLGGGEPFDASMSDRLRLHRRPHRALGGRVHALHSHV